MPLPIAAERIRVLNETPNRASGEYVLYWMQQSQRAEWNHALEYAIHSANEARLPVLVAFGLMDDYPEANARHYHFMLEGLRDVEAALENRGIGFVLRKGAPANVALSFGRKAHSIVVDRGYLRHQRAWREEVAAKATCRVTQVETDVAVPVDVVSGKCEIAARTLRPKLWRNAERFLQPLRATSPHVSWSIPLRSDIALDDAEKAVRTLKVDHSVGSVSQFFTGGTRTAKRLFERFCAQRLHHYAERRNHPENDEISHMSPYLHFGQISPVWLALEAEKFTSTEGINVQSFVEELLVRRELAMNFVAHESNYDTYAAVPAWAQQTLEIHASDRRPHCYDPRQFENAETHDPYWNAAMREMRFTGFMHNYMRMYWGKKILEWSASPQEAFATLLTLNNRYFLDGRDPNSYANAGWIFGLHDRPWPERAIFGTVRSMMASGLERKCDIKEYVRKVDRLVEKAGGPPAGHGTERDLFER